MTEATEPVTNKARMYRLLAAGAFGNTVPQFFSVHEWRLSGQADRYPLWGVRTLTPGGPCRLYCPADEVADTVASRLFQKHRVNISCMVDAVCTVTAFIEVMESETGLLVYAVEHPGAGTSWRHAMPRDGVQTGGLRARMLLRRHLNADSLDDLESLLEKYPGHVVELSALEECFGTVPGRNAVVWEVRRY